MAQKILFLSHKFNPDIGGIETLSDMIASYYHEVGYDVRLVTWSERPSTKDFPFPVIRNPSINQLVKEHKWADIVFENNPSLRLSWPVLLFRKPTVIALQTWLKRVNGKTSWQDRLKHIWLKRAKKVISCSEAIRRECWPKSTVIQNPYQEKLFRVLPGDVRPKDFVFLGRLVSDKGADLAVKAFSIILSQNKDNDAFNNLSFTIIGNGPEEEKLKLEVKSLGLEDQIIFTGAMSGEALVSCLNQHKFLLVPSMWEEPFGIVALEGMACGCIPIVSNGGGLPDAVGKAGLTFKRGDVNSLVDCMTEIISNTSIQQQLRSEAPMHLDAHSSSRVSQKYGDVIKEVQLAL